MTWAVRPMARCTQTGTSGSQSHAGSAFVTTVRCCAMKSSAMSWPIVRRWSSQTASAAPSARLIHPLVAGRALSVGERSPSAVYPRERTSIDNFICSHTLIKTQRFRAKSRAWPWKHFVKNNEQTSAIIRLSDIRSIALIDLYVYVSLVWSP